MQPAYYQVNRTYRVEGVWEYNKMCREGTTIQVKINDVEAMVHAVLYQ